MEGGPGDGRHVSRAPALVRDIRDRPQTLLDQHLTRPRKDIMLPCALILRSHTPPSELAQQLAGTACGGHLLASRTHGVGGGKYLFREPLRVVPTEHVTLFWLMPHAEKLDLKWRRPGQFDLPRPELFGYHPVALEQCRETVIAGAMGASQCRPETHVLRHCGMSRCTDLPATVLSSSTQTGVRGRICAVGCR